MTTIAKIQDLDASKYAVLFKSTEENLQHHHSSIWIPDTCCHSHKFLFLHFSYTYP
jgi:hypothetical protein